jgi:hypothetical protein
MRTDDRSRVQILLAVGFGSLAALALAACPGSLKNPDDLLFQGEGGGLQCPDAPEKILIPKCAGSGCHSPPNPMQGLDLISAGVGARLVDHLATECDGNLADPTDPEGSILAQKIGDKPPCGARMPLNGPVLTAEEITCIKVWITSLQPKPGTGGAGGVGGTGGAAQGGGNMGGGAG